MLLALQGCGKKEAEETPQGAAFESNEMLQGKIHGVLNTDAKFILKGKFATDSLNEIASGSEVMNKKEWGIRFYLLSYKDGKFQKSWETPLLNGSFKESKVEKLRMNNIDHDYVYYNSLNYFMGSSSGEVLSYIIDLKAQIVYYAHLVMEPEGKVELFVSNSGNNDILKYYTTVFKKDYPALKLTDKDPVLD